MKGNAMVNRITELMQLNAQPIPGRPLVEILDFHSVLIENHCGVGAYSDSCIHVKTKSGEICISGEGMVLRRMSKEQLRICGKILGITLHGRRSY